MALFKMKYGIMALWRYGVNEFKISKMIPRIMKKLWFLMKGEKKQKKKQKSKKHKCIGWKNIALFETWVGNRGYLLPNTFMSPRQFEQTRCVTCYLIGTTF